MNFIYNATGYFVCRLPTWVPVYNTTYHQSRSNTIAKTCNKRHLSEKWFNGDRQQNHRDLNIFLSKSYELISTPWMSVCKRKPVNIIIWVNIMKIKNQNESLCLKTGISLFMWWQVLLNFWQKDVSYGQRNVHTLGGIDCNACSFCTKRQRKHGQNYSALSLSGVIKYHWQNIQM